MKQLAVSRSDAVAAPRCLRKRNMRVRGTISSLDGDVAYGEIARGQRCQAAPHARRAGRHVAKKVAARRLQARQLRRRDLGDRRAASWSPRSARDSAAGAADARRWDSMPDSMMTNANIAGQRRRRAAATSSRSSTRTASRRSWCPTARPSPHLRHRRPRRRSSPARRSSTGARVEGDGKLVTHARPVSKDGVKPEH